MAAVDDVDQLIEQYHLRVDEFLKGNPEPVLELWSRGDDVTLTNPYGGVAHGWEQVVEASEQAASTRKMHRIIEQTAALCGMVKTPHPSSHKRDGRTWRISPSPHKYARASSPN